MLGARDQALETQSIIGWECGEVRPVREKEEKKGRRRIFSFVALANSRVTQCGVAQEQGGLTSWLGASFV